MATTLTLAPKTQMAGTFQDVAPVPTDGSVYTRPVQLWATSMAYWAGDANAAAAQNGPFVLDVLPTTAPIQVIATAEYAWVDTPLATHNMPYPTVPAKYGGAIQAGDLIVVDISEQEAGTTAAPTTHTGFTSRGSFSNGTAWVPRDTRLFKMSGSGGESGTFAVTWAVARRVHAYVRVIRGVDPASFFDVAGPTASYGQGSQPDPPSNGPLVVPGSLFESVMAGNIFPSGYTFGWDDADAPDGMTVNFQNTQRARFFVGLSAVGGAAGTSLNPPAFDMVTVPDNWTVLTDVYKAKLYSNATLILLTAMADETETTSVSGTPPTIPALNTLQRITSTLTAGTFTLTFGGNTTAAINWNDSAATIQTRLRALASIGATGCNVTGGPINSNPVVVEFTGSLGGADQALITTSTGSVTVVETQVGAAGYTFTFEGNVDVPRTVGGAYQPQMHVWSLQPGGVWPYNRQVSMTVSSHAANKTWAAELLAFANLRAGNPVGDVFGSFVADPAESVAIFGSITPSTPGSLILAALAKAKTDGSNYSASLPYEAGAPMTSDPARYYNAGRVAADGMTLQTWLSNPVASGSAETLSSVSWAGLEHYTDTLLELVPASSAGTLTTIQVLSAQTQTSWLELANAMGSLYEVFELDLSSMPSDAKFSSISFTFSHESNVRGALRVVPVGIKADGSFVAGQERRVGGYQLDAVDTAQTVTTGEWFELADGSRLAEYSRIGVAVYSTRRHDAVTTHRLYWLTASLTFETGGPVVANVVGPPTPGAPITWEFSSGGGLAQRAVRVLAIQGGDADLEDPTGFLDVYFNDFTTLPASPDWEIYDGAGNAGFGVRRASALSIVADGTASAGQKLRISATNGAGGDAGKIVSGGLKLKKPFTYGQIEVRFQGSGDANNFMSPVVLLWPRPDLVRFPQSTGGEWPAGGEINIAEFFSSRDDLNPIEHHLHRLKLGVSPPYDASKDEFLDFSYPLAATAWRKVVLNWLPTGISVSVDNNTFQTLTTDPKWIPSWPMELCLQFDAWANGTLGATRTMDIDYVVVRRVASTITYPTNPLDPQSGEVVADSGWLYGASRRSFVFSDQPLGRGNQTFLVKARALMNNGVEIESKWGIDEIQDISGAPPAPGTQGGQPRFNSATGGVDVRLTTPAGVTRAWLARSTDEGASWELVGAFDVSPSADVTVTDYGAPLAQSKLRYTVSFDSGPNSETTTAAAVGSGDISTAIDSWWWIVPDDPTLNTRIEVSRIQRGQPHEVLVAGDATGTLVVDSGRLPEQFALTLRTRSAAERARVQAVLDSGMTVRMVNILGEEWRVRLASNVEVQLLRWAPLLSDTTKLRDAHEITIELQEVV